MKFEKSLLENIVNRFVWSRKIARINNESDPPTAPVQAVADYGAWVSVVDRRQFNPAIEDLYVAGDTSGFGKVSGESMTSQMPDGGAIVVLRGIPTAIELTAVGLTSNAPVSGTFVIGSVLVTQENAMDFYYPDSPF